VGIVTDLGYVTNLVREKLKGCDCLVIESNHDPELLRVGPYPWELKRRVGGRHGHLSNDEAASLISELTHDRLKLVVLAHVSRKNNRYDLADVTARSVLQKTDGPVELVVARQESVSPLFEINPAEDSEFQVLGLRQG
jgi:phosphoribosyl 1,2-cyclic phosphodiesterase